MAEAKMMVLSFDRNSRVVINIIMLVLYVAIYIIFPESIFAHRELSLSISVFILSLLVHEFLHGIAAMACGYRYSDISYHFALEKGGALCEIIGPITKRNMLLISLFPVLVLFTISMSLFFMTLNLLFICIGYLMLLGGIIDLIFVVNIIRLPKDSVFLEPESPLSGFVIRSKNDGLLKLYIPLIMVKHECEEGCIKNETSKSSISIISIIIFTIALVDILKTMFV